MRFIYFDATAFHAYFWLQVVEIVRGECSWAVFPPNTEITDLRTPTPLSITFTDRSISGCQTAPSTGVASYTAVANGTYYSELSPATFLFSAQPTIYVPVVFPDLIVAQLTPGEDIFVQWTESVNPSPSSGTGGFYMTVPLSALINPPWTTPTSTMTTISTTTPLGSPSKSPSTTPVGQIVGGVVGGLGGISLLALLLWVYLRYRKSNEVHIVNLPIEEYPMDRKPGISKTMAGTTDPDQAEVEDLAHPGGRLRYPTEDI